MIRTLGLGLVPALALVAAPAFGDVLLYEPFSYDLAADLNGAGASEIGFDAGSTWTKSDDANATGSGTMISPVSFGSLVTNGQRLQLVNSGTFGNTTMRFNRPLSVDTAAPTTLWISYLYQSDLGGSGATHFAVNQGSGSGGGDQILQVNGKNTVGTSAAGISVDTSRGDGNGSIGIQDGATYLLLGKFAIGATETAGEVWVFSESAFADLVAAGIDEANLDAHAIDNIGETELGDFAIDPATNTYQLEFYAGTNDTKTVLFDELRFATTLGEALPIPEPASLALMAMGGLLMLRRRVA